MSTGKYIKLLECSFLKLFFQNATHKQGKKDPVALHFFGDTKSPNNFRLETLKTNLILEKIKSVKNL